MSSEPENLVLEILKKMQGDLRRMEDKMSSLGRIETDVADIKVRVTRLEDITRRQRRDTAGILVMMKSVAGDFEERIAALEDDATRRGPPPG